MRVSRNGGGDSAGRESLERVGRCAARAHPNDAREYDIIIAFADCSNRLRRNFDSDPRTTIMALPKRIIKVSERAMEREEKRRVRAGWDRQWKSKWSAVGRRRAEVDL